MSKQIKTTIILAAVMLMVLLGGCGMLGTTSTPTETSSTTTDNTVQISQNNAALALDVEQEVAVLREQVATLSAQVDQISATASDTPISNSDGVMSANALQSTLTELYDTLNPSVVYISVSSFQGGLPVGNGSGFVYDNDGHIVTNNHVVTGAAQLEVIFADGSRSPANVVGTDIDADLAVIRVDQMPEGVQPLPLSSMAALDVGQFVVAFGSPFGEQGSMSLGIISGLGRSLSSQRALDTSSGTYQLPQVIQTDAPINPGNSGGPLLNLAGEVVGVNSTIRTDTGENSGVGFAIPADAISRIAPDLIANGSYTYPYLGLSFLNEEFKLSILEQSNSPQTAGAYVGSASPGGPAATAGIQGADSTGFGGDLIIDIDGNPIIDFDDLNAYLVFQASPGQVIQVTVLRDGQAVTIPVTLGERP